MSGVLTVPGVVVRFRAPLVDATFRALGTDVRLIAEGRGASAAVSLARAEILDYDDRLSRFAPCSELSALNTDARRVVPATALLRAAVRAAIWAAEKSGGLVDPCLLDALCAAGYEHSFKPVGEVPLPAGSPRPATPDAAERWRSIRIDEEARTITRPAGLRLDLGGSGKGHVADRVARHFTGLSQWVVDCGGDIRLGGTRQVEIAHPVHSDTPTLLQLTDGAIATSSVVGRAWLRDDGTRSHHLIDPGTREPAWTGLLSATALAPTTLHAETLAKTALLLGPEGARDVLAARGSLVVHASGDVEAVGPLPEVLR